MAATLIDLLKQFGRPPEDPRKPPRRPLADMVDDPTDAVLAALERDIVRHGGNIAPDLLELSSNSPDLPQQRPVGDTNPPWTTIRGGPTMTPASGLQGEDLADWLTSTGAPKSLADVYRTVPYVQKASLSRDAMGRFYDTPLSIQLADMLSRSRRGDPGEDPRAYSTGMVDYETKYVPRHEAIHAKDFLAGVKESGSSMSRTPEFQDVINRIRPQLETRFEDKSVSKPPYEDWPHVLTWLVDKYLDSVDEGDPQWQIPEELRPFLEKIIPLNK